MTIDKAFSAVIQACAERKNTWINREIIETLNTAWKLLTPIPAELLKRIPKEFIEQFHGRK